jgi:hypothetical protein
MAANSQLDQSEPTNHGMQRSGGGEFFGEINVNSRRPLIPTVRRHSFLTTQPLH